MSGGVNYVHGWVNISIGLVSSPINAKNNIAENELKHIVGSHPIIYSVQNELQIITISYISHTREKSKWMMYSK